MGKLVENAQMLAHATREAVTALGLELFSSAPGSSVTAVRAPKGLDSGVIIKEFRSRFNAIITNGQGSMKGQIFRLAHLGYFDFHDLFAVVAELEIILAAQGLPVRFGAGVSAVQNVYAEVAQERMARSLGEALPELPYARIEEGAHTMAFIEACVAAQAHGGWHDVARLPVHVSA